MASDYPPYDGGYHDDGSVHERRGVHTFGILAIGVFAVLSFYSAIVVASFLDHIVLPGNELFSGFPVVEVFGGDGPQPDQAETIDDRINVLFLGLDRRIDEAEDQPYRTDSVMVLTIDPFSKTAGAFSIPRDTVVEYYDADGDYYTTARINEGYEFGEYPYELGVNGLANYPGGGAGLVMDTINKNFGIPIDHYMVMDWIDFIDIINELGGVDIDIPEYAYDPAYTICTYCGEIYPVEFVPGTEHMDGERALAYSRIRKSDNDYKRIERQQLVLKAMAAKAASVEAILDNPIGLYNKFRDAIQTDVSDFRAGGLGVLFKQVQDKANAAGLEPIRTISMAPATYPCRSCAYAGLEWDPEVVEELKAQVFSDSRLSSENAIFDINNATPTDGMASDFGDILRRKGVPSINIVEDEFANGEIYDTTVVIDVTGGHDYSVAQVVDWLGLPAGRVITSADPQAATFQTFLDTAANIVVMLGKDVQVDELTGDFTVIAADPLVSAGG